MKIQKGQEFLITHGERDDFVLEGTYRAIADFDGVALIGQYLLDNNYSIGNNYSSGWQMDKFVKWMENKGKIVGADLPIWHLGDYRLGDG